MYEWSELYERNMTLEYCCSCTQPTGRAGRGEDSLYTEEGEGPFCPECWKTYEDV